MFKLQTIGRAEPVTVTTPLVSNRNIIASPKSENAVQNCVRDGLQYGFKTTIGLIFNPSNRPEIRNAPPLSCLTIASPLHPEPLLTAISRLSMPKICRNRGAAHRGQRVDGDGNLPRFRGSPDRIRF